MLEEDNKNIHSNINSNLQNSIRNLNETIEIAKPTMIELHNQGNKIEKSINKVEVIEDHLKYSNNLLDNISNWFGRFKNRFSNNKVYREQNEFSKYNKSNIDPTSPSLTSTYQNSTLNNSIKDDDEALDKISDMLSNINNMGHYISDELDRQNSMIDDLENKLSNQNNTLKKTNQRMKNI